MKLLIQHNQEIAQLSPDPFPLLRVGSGDETTFLWHSDDLFFIIFFLKMAEGRV